MSTRHEHWLFGYPISHSAAPPFQNTVFSALDLPNRYRLCETKQIDEPQVKDLLSRPSFAGAAFTMPLKVDVMRILDRIDEAASKIGSVNTVYLDEVDGRVQYCGTNTDWLGVKNSLSPALPSSIPSNPSSFIIGGGGTTRAAVYALTNMGAKTIYLINRDESESQAVVDQFPDLNLIPLISASQWTADMADSLVYGVGAIPDIPPVTASEREVYKIAETIFRSCVQVHGKGQCSMLEMAYKPRRTTMLKLAESIGWRVVGGVEAMIEQGFAQDRIWLYHSASSPYPADQRPADLPEHVVDAARTYIRNMDDIVKPTEVPPAEAVADVGKGQAIRAFRPEESVRKAVFV